MWQMPSPGWVKLNSDGLVLHSGRASCGGVICDSLRFFVCRFVPNLGCYPITIAELWGGYH